MTHLLSVLPVLCYVLAQFIHPPIIPPEETCVIVPLLNDRKAEIRDRLQGGDFRIGREAIKFQFRDDGSRELDGGMELRVKTALLTRLIAQWDIPGLPPRLADAVDPVAVLDGLDEEDYQALMTAVQPAYDKVMESNRPKTSSPSTGTPTGS
jgi:hypothetical protein